MTKEEILTQYEADKRAAYDKFSRDTSNAYKAWKKAVDAAWKEYEERFLKPLFVFYKASCDAQNRCL